MKAPALLALAMLACAALQAQANPPERVRQFAALPPWTGIWETEVAAQLASGELDQALAGAEHNPATAAFTLAPPGVLLPLEVEFFRRAQLLGTPPYNRQWQQVYEQRKREVKATPASAVNMGDIRACTQGYPLLMESATDGMFELLVTPEETLLLFADGELRHIYTDGRPHPKQEDLWATELGNSIGHWQGNTLVIDTIERKAGPLIPIAHFVSPDLSEQAHFVERLRQLDRDHMQNDMTIEDPARLARPWRLTLRYRRVTDMDRLIATNCTENDRNPVVNGKVTIAPR
jgi:hypothetical protein